ncbi:DeoR/GlpR family DNA-binding transcription regulator [Cohnella thailandensis]|uniref:DeoR/GlpR transcriptional regulator n=1 Tax=Cohnella thailandensis TaxID=557557 RepID=A0A841STZ8_9BACL|nr:DeoR/GlpR family DNA-binding transcription regulator [Cohnella thailandensis]MBB6635793.1 DeoR/GlpR transcriptional regulator [Cohnella thailandensis]MBP1976171.1 DeoR family transcriptional regulator of aga operon [Cohnella thailandensis]
MLMGTRQHEILKLLELNQQMTIGELAEKFNVSQMTIRRDLDQLQSEGKIQRSHGGAVKVKRFMGSNYDQRASENKAEKLAIAKEAAKHIQDGMSIILDAGTTVAAMVDELEKFKGLKIITRDLHTALLLSNEERFGSFDVYCTGGRLSKWAYSLDGIYAEKMLSSLTVDVTFLTCEAVSHAKGAMAWSPVLVGARQTAMNAAGVNILLADSTKFSYNSLAIFASLDSFDEIITDDGLDEDELEVYRTAGYSVRAVPAES